MKKLVAMFVAFAFVLGMGLTGFAATASKTTAAPVINKAATTQKASKINNTNAKKTKKPKKTKKSVTTK